MKKDFGIIHFSDTHLNPLNRIPQAAKENYHEIVYLEFQELKKQIKDIKDSYEKLAVCLSGDVFNLKQQSYYVPKVIEYYSKLFEDVFSGLEVYCIPGNHDMTASSFDLIGESAYNVWQKATKNVIDISNKTIEINDFLTISGVPYYNYDKTIESIKNLNLGSSKVNVALLHADIFQSSKEADWYMSKFLTYNDIAYLNKNINLALLGHIHKETSPAKVENCWFSKPHAFSRMSKEYLEKDDIQESFPSYSLISISKEGDINIKTKRITKFAASEFIDFNDLLLIKERSNKFEDFIKELQDSFGSVEESFTIQDPNGLLEKVTISVEVKNIINKYLER